jgi:hypothetical protein
MKNSFFAYCFGLRAQLSGNFPSLLSGIDEVVE